MGLHCRRAEPVNIPWDTRGAVKRGFKVSPALLRGMLHEDSRITQSELYQSKWGPRRILGYTKELPLSVKRQISDTKIWEPAVLKVTEEPMGPYRKNRRPSIKLIFNWWQGSPGKREKLSPPDHHGSQSKNELWDDLVVNAVKLLPRGLVGKDREKTGCRGQREVRGPSSNRGNQNWQGTEVSRKDGDAGSRSWRLVWENLAVSKREKKKWARRGNSIWQTCGQGRDLCLQQKVEAGEGRKWGCVRLITGPRDSWVMSDSWGQGISSSERRRLT